MQRFFEIFRDGPFEGLDKFADAILQTEDGAMFHVHRFQLALKNNYFKTMYRDNFTDNTDVLVKGIDGDTFGHVLYYLYTNDVVLDRGNIMNLWIASDYFLADSLKQICREFVQQELNVDNCLEVFMTAWNNEGLGFIETSFRYLIVHFQDVIANCFSKYHSFPENTNLDVLKDLPFKALKMILESKCLNVINERMVWNVIATWFGKDCYNKHQHIPELLKCMYMEDTDEELSTEIKNSTIAEDHSFLNDKSDEFSQNLLENFASGSRLPSNLQFVSHNSEGSFGADLYLTSDGSFDFWRKLEARLDFYPAHLAQMGYNIFMFDMRGRNIMAFNLLDGSRSVMPPLFFDRLKYNVVSVLDQIYVLGGEKFTFENGLRGDGQPFIERYDPVTDSWSLSGPILHEMNFKKAVVINNCIYIIGLIDEERNPSMMMEVLDMTSNEQHIVEVPLHPRDKFSAAVFRGKLYIIGGEANGVFLRTVEEYDPEENSWRNLPILPVPYRHTKAIELGDLLIVFENYLENIGLPTGPLPPVFFDMENERWTKIDESSPLFNINQYLFCNISQPDIVKGLVRNNRLLNAKWIASYLA